MAGQARKELELKMTVTVDAKNSTAAMQQLRAEAERAGMAVKALGPSSNRPGAWEQVKGGVGGFAGGVAGIGAAVATIGELNKAWHQLDNSMLSTREKITGFAAAIPIIGSALEGLTTSMLNFAERMANPELAGGVEEKRMRQGGDLARMRARSEMNMRAFGLTGETAAYNRLAIQAFPTLASGNGLLRGSVGGITGSFADVGFSSMDPRLQAGMEAIQAARQQSLAADLATADSLSAVRAGRPGVRGTMRQLRVFGSATDAGQAAASSLMSREATEYGQNLGWYKYGSLAGDFGVGLANLGLIGPGSQTARQNNVLNEQKQLAAAQAQVAEQEQKIAKLKQDQLASARAANELAKAQTNLMQTQVQILDEQINKLRGGSREFGMMDQVSRGELLTTARRFKAQGREGVTADELQMLMGNSLTRDLVGQRAEQSADSDPTFMEFKKLLGLRDVKDVQTERDKLKLDMDMKIQLDKEQFAKTMEDSLKSINLKDLLGEIVKNQMEVKARESQLGQFARQAQLGQ